MNYKESIKHSLTVKWKTTPCSSGEDCWCRVIEPEQEIKDDDGNEIYIARGGCVPKDYAEHIVKLQNASLNVNMENKKQELINFGKWLTKYTQFENYIKQDVETYLKVKSINSPEPSRAIGENKQAEEEKSDCCNAPIEVGFMYDRCTKCNQHVND